MPTVKTAISMERSLFEQVNAAADELALPRSRLLALAVEDYLRRYENRKLLAALNAAYDDSPDAEEQERLVQMRSKHRAIVEGTW